MKIGITGASLPVTGRIFTVKEEKFSFSSSSLRNKESSFYQDVVR
jgi:hypothetical protein